MPSTQPASPQNRQWITAGSALQTPWLRYFRIALAVAATQLRIASRYPGALLIDISLPILITLAPVLLGNTLANMVGTQSFAANTGTSDYAAYMLIGSSVFFMVRSALLNMGMWIQREQRSGTLESLYLTPTSRFWLLSGVFLYSIGRSACVFCISFTLGCLIFAINPLQGNISLALAFLILGAVPIQGISLAYGALVLRFKEAEALIQIAQWIVGLLMGLYFPLAILPWPLQGLALIFPPTWVNNGVRAALLDVAWFTGAWYTDLAIVGLFGIVMPYLGYWLFRQIERALQRNEGIGMY